MTAERYSAVAQRIIHWLFHLLLVLTPFIFTWINDELFEFNKMIVTYAITLSIVGLWISRMVIEKRIIWRRTALDIPLGLFLLSQLASTIFSIHPYTSFFGFYTRFHGGLFSWLTYAALFYSFINNVPRAQMGRYWLSTVVAGVGIALYSIPEHFGHSPSCFLITGGMDFGVNCWIQDVKSRIFGTFGQPNWLAAYVITLIPLALSLALTQFHKSRRWLLYAGGSVAFFAVLLFTQSRSGLLGLVAGYATWLAGMGLWHWRQRSWSKISWKAAAVVLGLQLAVLVIAGSIYTPSLTQLVTPQSTPAPTVETTAAPVNRLEVGGTDSGDIRRIVWEGALAVARRYPILGSGVETFAYSYYQDRPAAHNLVSEWDFLYNKAHNEFLNFLATTGIVGLLTYCLLLGWFGWLILRLIWKSSAADTNAVTTAIGMGAGIVALSVSNFLGFSTVMVTILMFLYFAWTEMLYREKVTAETETRATSTKETKQALSTYDYVALTCVALATLYALSWIMTIWIADFHFYRGKQLIAAGYTGEGVSHLEQAITQSPQEAVFYEELSTTYAAAAVQLAAQQQATAAAEVAQAALANSAKSLELNPRHLNFYKSQARVYITLAELNEDFLGAAEDTLTKALALAPTDAKLLYNLGLVQNARGKTTEALATLQKAIELKPNYDSVRAELGRQYEAQGNYAAALEQYQYLATYLTNTPELTQKIQALTASLSAQRK